MPTVSVVVPTYNRADLLEATLESVLEQTYADWECIVVDDGSTDDTPDVAAAFCARDPRVRYLRQSNADVSAARNHGLHHARGRYVVFLDSDDLLVPDRLEWQVAVLDQDPEAVLVYGDAWEFESGDLSQGKVYLAHIAEKPQGWVFDQLIALSPMYSPLVRTEAVRRVGGFEENLRSAEDWDLWLSLSKEGPFRFEPRIATYYRIHQGGKSKDFVQNLRYARRVVRRHTQGLPSAQRRAYQRRARAYFQAGYDGFLAERLVSLASDRRWREALTVLWERVRLKPSSLFHPVGLGLRRAALAAWHGPQRDPAVVSPKRSQA